jgi:hypothetical protein
MNSLGLAGCGASGCGKPQDLKESIHGFPPVGAWHHYTIPGRHPYRAGHYFSPVPKASESDAGTAGDVGNNLIKSYCSAAGRQRKGGESMRLLRNQPGTLIIVDPPWLLGTAAASLSRRGPVTGYLGQPDGPVSTLLPCRSVSVSGSSAQL